MIFDNRVLKYEIVKFYLENEIVWLLRYALVDQVITGDLFRAKMTYLAAFKGWWETNYKFYQQHKYLCYYLCPFL